MILTDTPNNRPRKLYAYVDESGQHTEGSLFIVGTVIVSEERDKLRHQLFELEHVSGKGASKWVRSKDSARSQYIERVLSTDVFQNRLYYGMYRNTREFVPLTIATTAKAILQFAMPHKATVIVDGLNRYQRDAFAVGLRKAGIRTEKVRGATDESDPIIRLADALCGFLADVEQGRSNYKSLLNTALSKNMMIDVT